MGMAFPVFSLRQACCTVTLSKHLILLVFPPGSTVHRRERMCEMSGSRRNIANVVATTYILVRGFSDIVEEIDVQEFFAGMLCSYFSDGFCGFPDFSLMRLCYISTL